LWIVCGGDVGTVLLKRPAKASGPVSEIVLVSHTRRCCGSAIDMPAPSVVCSSCWLGDEPRHSHDEELGREKRDGTAPAMLRSQLPPEDGRLTG